MQFICEEIGASKMLLFYSGVVHLCGDCVSRSNYFCSALQLSPAAGLHRRCGMALAVDCHTGRSEVQRGQRQIASMHGALRSAEAARR